MLIVQSSWEHGFCIIVCIAFCTGARVSHDAISHEIERQALQAGVASLADSASDTDADGRHASNRHDLACVMFDRVKTDLVGMQDLMQVAGAAQGYRFVSIPLIESFTEPFCVSMEEKLGGGSDSNVFSGRVEGWSSGIGVPEFLAVKVPASNASIDTSKFQKEMEILEHLRIVPDHIVQIYGYNDAGQALAIERLTGGSLEQKRRYFGRLAISEWKKVVWQIVEAVASCHKVGVLHRDLKEEQFLFEKSTDSSGKEDWSTRLKLVDFGESSLERGLPRIHRWAAEELEQKWDDRVGTPNYMSPEVVWNGVFYEEEMKTFSLFAPDIWAVGVIAFQIVSGKIFVDELFEKVERRRTGRRLNLSSSTPTILSLLRRMVEASDDDIDKVLANNVNDEALLGFLKQCLRVDPSRRASASDLQKSLWLSSGLLTLFGKAGKVFGDVGKAVLGKIGVRTDEHEPSREQQTHSDV